MINHKTPDNQLFAEVLQEAPGREDDTRPIAIGALTRVRSPCSAACSAV